MNTIDLDLGSDDFKSIDLDNNFTTNSGNSVKFGGFTNSSSPTPQKFNSNPPRLVVHDNLSSKSNNIDMGADMLFNPDKIKKRPSSPSVNDSSFGKSLYTDIDKPSFPKMSSPSFQESKHDNFFDDVKSFDVDTNSGIKPPTDFNFDDFNSNKGNLFDTPTETYSQPMTNVKQKTEEEIQNEKFELLLKLDRIKEKKGIVVSRNYTMASPLEDIKQEYEKLVYIKRLDNWTKQCKRGLLFCVNGIEMLNNKYDPFDIDLDGWGDEIYADQDEYDDVFEELYDKYKGKGTMAPEIKLLLGLSGSAFAFAMKKSVFNRAVPGMDEVMRQNPDVLKNFFQGQQPQQTQQQSNNRRPDMREPDNVDDIIDRLSRATTSEEVNNINVGRGGRDISMDL